MAAYNNSLHLLASLFQLAYFSLKSHPLRTILSLTGIICGTAALLTVIGLGQGAKMEAKKQIEKMGVRNLFIRPAPLTREQFKQAGKRHSPGLGPQDMTILSELPGNIIQSGYLREIRVEPTLPTSVSGLKVVGCTANYGDILDLPLAEGRFLAEEDLRRKNAVCVIGGEAARSLAEAGRLNAYLRINNHLFLIVGILERYDTGHKESGKFSMQNINEMIFLPVTIELSRPTNRGQDLPAYHQSELIVEIDKVENIPTMTKLIDRTLSVAHQGIKDYQIIVPLELLTRASEIQRVFNMVFGAVAAISLLTGGIGIMNIMLASVSERTAEIGLRMAVGATPHHITIQFLAEAALVTAGGGVIGTLLGIICVYWVGYFSHLPIHISVSVAIIPFSISTIIGLCFGIIPARNAARLDPVRTLTG
ncbi:MAG: ABC transporter permease [Desulfobulbaceae bacterium]|nr:ABC transporter permease [Desulfobulbaceae bacterium]